MQLYLHDILSSVSIPAKQLRGFEKVPLAAGETKTVRFRLIPRDLALVNLQMQTVIEPGGFEVLVGSSSAQIHLKGRFTVQGG